MKNSEFEQSYKEILEVGNNDSWFRGDPYRWPLATLPMAYASAIVEVVIKRSEPARNIYDQLVEAWGRAKTQKMWEELTAELTETEKERINQAFLHPEKELYPDPNKPYKEFEELIKSLEMNGELLEGVEQTEPLSPEDEKEAEELGNLIKLILDFILVGFNRESDIEKGRFRVLPSKRAPWLIVAVMIRSSFDYHNVTLERLRRLYQMNKHKGKIIDFHKVMTEEPMSRWHRRIVASGKAAKLKLKNDRIFLNAARNWYQCRVVYESINQYCDAQSEKGILVDLKNLQKQIKPCDDVLGYIRRLPKKTD
jgi:hypothetical protein